MYSELEKLKAVRDKSQVCGEFLAWLLSKYELATYHVHVDECYDEEGDRVCERLRDELCRVQVGIEHTLAEYFEIDLQRVEKEKQALLETIRAKHDAPKEQDGTAGQEEPQ